MPLSTISGEIQAQPLNDNFSYLDTNKSEVLVINVKSSAYGAVGNGTTDDTLAFKNAITAAMATGGILFVPATTSFYKITGSLEITTSMKMMGENWTFNGASILKFFMDGLPLTTPAINIHGTNTCHLENIYILNGGTEARDGMLFKDSNNMSCKNVISSGWGKDFYVNNVWIVSFHDCYAGPSAYGFYANGGTITTLLFDHCYAANNTSSGYYINTTFYTTFINCATDFSTEGYSLWVANAVAMIGCGCEGAVSTAINIIQSTVVIDGFTSAGNGTDSAISTASMLNAITSRLNCRGMYEQSLAVPNYKIASISIDTNCTGEYVSCHELLPISFPKNARFLFNGQAFTTGLPSATGWLSTDIGKTVYESVPVEAGVTGSKTVKFGYVRLTSGNGTALNTDWFALNALTGN